MYNETPASFQKKNQSSCFWNKPSVNQVDILQMLQAFVECLSNVAAAIWMECIEVFSENFTTEKKYQVWAWFKTKIDAVKIKLRLVPA